jgi:high-affinity Fe2+/Pb2+ permease
VSVNDSILIREKYKHFSDKQLENLLNNLIDALATTLLSSYFMFMKDEQQKAKEAAEQIKEIRIEVLERKLNAKKKL